MNQVLFHFPDGTSESVEAYSQLNILAHAQLLERSLQSRCGGHCECCTCRIILKAGSLSPMKEPERELMTKAKVSLKGTSDQEWRLACQCFPEPGEDILIEVPSRSFRDERKPSGQ